MPGQYFLIAAGSKTSWSFDWSDYLATDDQGNEVETISTRLWTISPTHEDATPTLSGETSNVVFVAAPHRGFIYTLSKAIETSLGVQNSRTITLRCE